MPDERPLPLPAKLIEQHRTRVIDALSEHFALDHINVDELDQRIGRAYALTTPAELDRLLEGLPSLTTTPAAAPALLPIPASDGPAHRTLFALMSGVARRGAWTVPRRMTAVALMGGVEIDLRATRLPAVTTIRALAVMGGIVVTVPPGVRVESDGFAIMGGFEDQLSEPGSTSPEAPVVRVSGFAFMGGVEVKVSALIAGGENQGD